MEKQSDDIVGVVIRATSFELAAKLFMVIQRCGGRPIHFASHNVVNQAVKDPLDIAANFREELLALGLDVAPDAGNVQLGGAFAGELRQDDEDIELERLV